MGPAEKSSRGWLVVAWASLIATVLSGLLIAIGNGLDGGVSNPPRVATRVVHGNFAYLFWPMALAAYFWSRQLSEFGQRVAGLGFVFAACGALVALVVPWLSGSYPLPSALPLVRHPLHGAAIGLFLVGVWLALFAWLVSQRRQTARQMDALLWYPLLPFLLLFVASGWVWFTSGELPEDVRISNTLWVAVTLLSFLQASLLLRGWFLLLERDGRKDMLLPRWQHGLSFLTVFPAVLVLPLLALVGTDDPGFLLNFDLLSSWASWPVVTLSGLVLCICFVRARAVGSSPAARYAFVGSFCLSFLGALAGIVSEETGTLYQAQLHWTSGAVALAYVFLLGGTEFQGRMTIEGAARAGALRLEPLAWFFGLLAVGIGAGLYGLLLAAGVLTEVGGQASVRLLARWFVVSGALLVLVGGACSAGRLAKTSRRANHSGGWLSGMRDRIAGIDSRLRAALTTVLAIGMIGGIIALLPPQIGIDAPENGAGLRSENHDHVVGQMRGEVKERFDQGVVMLHARRYDEAATAFHRVLALAPEMPEAHVNMGFAMLGKEDYKLALDFFEGATELRVNQLNAYYGMALAYEGLGNIEAAMGAMKSYQHLTAPDDPFLPKVYAKLQQYEQQRGARAPAAGS